MTTQAITLIDYDDSDVWVIFKTVIELKVVLVN